MHDVVVVVVGCEIRQNGSNWKNKNKKLKKKICLQARLNSVNA
jgi:hypothetical protein